MRFGKLQGRDVAGSEPDLLSAPEHADSAHSAQTAIRFRPDFKA